ncbi:MAG: magnesium transporter CorA family protein [Thermoanaerobaculia bacterium]|jgi:magnesium transporter
MTIGTESAAVGTFHGRSFNPATREVRAFDRAGLAAELEDNDVFSWIDLAGQDIGVLNDVLRQVGIDVVLLSHFGEDEILPRIVDKSDCYAFYLYEILHPEAHLDTSAGLRELDVLRMIVVIGADYVITYHQRPLEAVDYVKEECETNFRLFGKSPGFIAFLFLSRCLYDYAHINLANDNYLDSIQARLLAGKAKELEQMISVAGTNILTLKKLTASLHIVLMLMVTKRSPFISEEARHSFAELMQGMQAVRGAIDSSHHLLDGIVGSFQANAAARMAEIARVLTVVSAIMLPLSLVAGIYGMNFQHMPELGGRYSYFIVLGFMAGLAVTLLAIFRKLGWIGTGRSR